MSASLKEVGAAILAALEPLSQDNGGQVEHVGRFRGQVTRKNGVNRETFGAQTALLLAFDGEKPETRFEERTLAKGTAQNIALSEWMVYCVVQRVDDADENWDGEGQDLGVSDLHDLVVGALNGLRISGLYRGECLDWIGTEWYATETDACVVHVAKFSARRPAPRRAAAAAPGVPFAGVQGNVNVTDDAETTVSVTALNAETD